MLSRDEIGVCRSPETERILRARARIAHIYLLETTSEEVGEGASGGGGDFVTRAFMQIRFIPFRSVPAETPRYIRREAILGIGRKEDRAVREHPYLRIAPRAKEEKLADAVYYVEGRGGGRENLKTDYVAALLRCRRAHRGTPLKAK